MSSTLPVQEGFIPFRGYRTWYRIAGDLSANKKGMFPLLTLHGGPGATHYGLIPLEKITETGRAIIFYDQLGCGNSDRPDDASIWSVKFFLDELIAIRRELELDQIHLFGHSWGGMLAMAYVLTQPSGVLSLVLASSLASGILIDAERKRVYERLPLEVREILSTQGWSEKPEYQQARKYFDTHHVIRHEPWPDFLDQANKRMNVEVNVNMWRPNKEGGQGELRTWDIRPRLREIHVPTLVTSGVHDGMSPTQDDILFQGIPQAKHMVFQDSAHFAHAEETDTYIAVLNEFLTQVEQSYQ
ncbi:proline iminopeptidase [Ktedonobacter sp. SOSP1-85]|uniref:proline iminopeptidase-family hydrolase n=1 Tax=Ktedonobacter sp. SOSP1-85 TaxID=2778367 RepID=UPI001A2DDA4D|nr:proline iminopeptidase-family hydrolase [Ktedonobacter sp. SOSP1-85]GHO79468.1 proline iminopeptidase [Ktedonobacter sp. SOSP1-85]